MARILPDLQLLFVTSLKLKELGVPINIFAEMQDV